MDFAFDELAKGRRVKTLTVMDDCSKKALHIAVDTSIPALCVARLLDQVKAERGVPKVIRTDNCPEFTGRAMQTWAARNGVELPFPSRQAGAEGLYRELRQPIPRRVPVAPLVRRPERHARRSDGPGSEVWNHQ